MTRSIDKRYLDYLLSFSTDHKNGLFSHRYERKKEKNERRKYISSIIVEVYVDKYETFDLNFSYS